MVRKRGTKPDVSNYRVISPTSTCVMMEMIITKQLTSFFLANNIIPKFQPHRSTVACLLHSLNRLHIIYLNFAKAFDHYFRN